MRFDRETEADRRMKSLAKQQGEKVAKKAINKAIGKSAAGQAGAKAAAAGKTAGAGIIKAIAAVIGAVGAPVILLIVCVSLLLLLLPSIITSSTISIDNKYDTEGLVATTIGPVWEDDAEQAIEERYRDLKTETFWADLETFFTTGSWGESGKRFETEYANAKDADMEGTDGYFSASNRLIALINEAYRQSLIHSRIKPEAQALATQAIPSIEEELRN